VQARSDVRLRPVGRQLELDRDRFAHRVAMDADP